jgi:hypothetical protein
LKLKKKIDEVKGETVRGRGIGNDNHSTIGNCNHVLKPVNDDDMEESQRSELVMERRNTRSGREREMNMVNGGRVEMVDFAG